MNATRETIINKFVTSSKRHEIFISKRFDASSKNVQLLQKKKKKNCYRKLWIVRFKHTASSLTKLTFHWQNSYTVIITATNETQLQNSILRFNRIFLLVSLFRHFPSQFQSSFSFVQPRKILTRHDFVSDTIRFSGSAIVRTIRYTLRFIMTYGQITINRRTFPYVSSVYDYDRHATFLTWHGGKILVSSHGNELEDPAGGSDSAWCSVNLGRHFSSRSMFARASLQKLPLNYRA